MLIALDYDKTYTLDPVFWNQFINLVRGNGHEVVCCTMRYPHESIFMPSIKTVHYTSRQAKRPFMEKLGIKIDVWIDDSPHFILSNALS